MNNDVVPVRKRALRGYVVLIVLLVLVAITTIVAGQLDTASNELLVGQAAEEEVSARGAAEGCLSLMTRYAENYMNNTMPCPAGAPCRTDFDSLLDRDNNRAESAGDYLPSIGTQVYINGSTPTQAWKFLNRGGDSACLVRFDDNSDDAVPSGGLPPGAVDATGPESDASRDANYLRDVQFLDRDRAIFITAIGLYPYRAATGPTGAYRAAHARVTLRRLLAISNPVTRSSAGVSAGNIDINNNATICGVGSMNADTIDTGNNGCYCGTVRADDLTGSIGTGNCPGCPTCDPLAYSDPGNIPPPVAEIPAWSNNFMHAEGWGEPVDYDTPSPDPSLIGPLTDGGETPFNGAAPASSGPHDPAVCSFRGQDLGGGVGAFFVWDTKDVNAIASVTALGVTTFTINGVDQLLTPDPPRNCTLSGEAIGAGGIVRDPCSWVESANSVICTASQSPCWKLIGRFGDGTTDLDMSPATVVVEASDAGFRPNASAPIPNIADSTQRWAAAAAGTRLCGQPAGAIPYCSSCNGLNEVLDWDGTDEWELDNTSQNTALPGPAVFALSSGAGRHIHIDNAGNTAASLAKPLHATILSGQELRLGNTNRFCGARLLCGGVTAAFDQAEADAVHRLPPGPGKTIGHSRGFVFKSTNLCAIANTSDLWGDIRCGTVNVANTFRLVGNLGAYDNGVPGGGTSGACSTSGTCSDAHLCLNNAPTIVGNIAVVGDVDLNNTGTIIGRLFVDGNICGNNGFTLTGAVIATGTFEMNNNLTIITDPDMAVGGSPTSFSPGMVSFMEASW